MNVRLIPCFLATLTIVNAQVPATEPRLPQLGPELPSPKSEEMLLSPEEFPLLPDDSARVKPKPAKRRLEPEEITPVLPPLDFAAGEAAVKIVVKRFEFTGHSVFSKGDLAKLTEPFTNREITSEDLEAARVAITKHYIDAGYISSGALLPDQDVAGGVVRFQIVEGKLKEVDLNGNFWFRDRWLRRQLARAAGNPVNFDQLKTGLQLLRQNPGITQINAELKPGLVAGENILHVIVKERHPFRLGLTLGNQRPPSVGEGFGDVHFEMLSLTGNNDPLELRWGALRWSRDGTVEFGEADSLFARYEFPVSPCGTTLAIHAGKNDASIVDETFIESDILSKSEEFGLTLRHPLIETLNDTLAITVGAERKHSETYLFGELPFSFSPGAIEGETDVFAWRLGVEWVHRNQLEVLSVRSTFSLGQYLLGATRDDPARAGGTTSGAGSGADPEIPDSKFFSWLGQVQYMRRIFDDGKPPAEPEQGAARLLRESMLVIRANAQLSDEPLLSPEQFSLGGLHSVRGYRENQLLRDNGIFASAELRIPLALRKDGTPIVTIAPFIDWGTGWDVNKIEDHNESIWSAGLGLIVQPSKLVRATVYWGHPFVRLNESSDRSLQDEGWHFTVSVDAF
jgi:hemolysin activation/secretion protein